MKIAPQEFNGHEVTLGEKALTNVLYTGSKSAPKYLVPGVDFVVESYQKNTKTGTAKVTLKGGRAFYFLMKNQEALWTETEQKS